MPITSSLVKMTDYSAKITKRENKIPDIGNLGTKTALNTIRKKKPNGSKLATKTALNAVENKIPDVSSLVKKQIITLKLLRLILRDEALMVKLLKIKQKMSLLKCIRECKNRFSFMYFGKYNV